MPEYLAPGVYIEETSFRAKTIEGLSTSTAGMVGPARFGPISGTPELLTSFADFERIYGGLDRLTFEDDTDAMDNYLAHGVRAFFENGGQRLYVARIYSKGTKNDVAFKTLPEPASLPSLPSTRSLTLKARYPGSGGNLRYTFTLRAGPNALVAVPRPSNPSLSDPALRGVAPFDVVWISDVASLSLPSGKIYWAERKFDSVAGKFTWTFHPQSGSDIELSSLDPAAQRVCVLTVTVLITYPGLTSRSDVYDNLGFHPAHDNSLAKAFAKEPSSRLKALTVPLVIETQPADMGGPEIASILFGSGISPADTDKQVTIELTNGSDGNRPQSAAYEGDDSKPKEKTGFKSFEDVAEISIVAAPGYSYKGNRAPWKTQALSIMGKLITHCEKMRYRIAVLDACNEQSTSEVMEYRGQVDSTYGALYYPWVRVVDPFSGDEINLPPSGYVSGIYARNDIEKGVHKAPANEVVRGAVGFEFTLNKAQQDVLNPIGINCFRSLEGRGNRLWGARTVTSDPEWKYVNLRRFFAYLERSIERGTQWAVFENNGDALWANVRRTIEDFLYSEWKSGRLMGEKPEEAYFVRCDRSTMSQNDIDNGRMICLIGVAPLRPAEFVIFRIGQWVGQQKS